MTFPSIYPQPVVEAGFTAGPAAVASGNLILDDGALGLLGTGTLAAGTIWTDITAFVHDISVTRPGNRQQGPLVSYEAATAAVTLNTSDARFSPDNPRWPYVSSGRSDADTADDPAADPHHPGRGHHPLFSGFTSSWVPPTEDFGAFYGQTGPTRLRRVPRLEGVQLPGLGSPVGAGFLAHARVN